ncbi:MAG: polysaccharide deacetylase family protein [Taibaiella sp.]|nr:polysaccharide deacetylase family protein [Taibaiella sp.]
MGIFFSPSGVKEIPGEKQHIAITFDDGPSAYTKSVLEVLAQYDAPATFFCIGKENRKIPGSMQADRR